MARKAQEAAIARAAQHTTTHTQLLERSPTAATGVDAAATAAGGGGISTATFPQTVFEYRADLGALDDRKQLQQRSGHRPHLLPALTPLPAMLQPPPPPPGLEAGPTPPTQPPPPEQHSARVVVTALSHNVSARKVRPL